MLFRSGNGAIGNFRKAKNPASTTAIVNSVVATGRAMNGADGLTLRRLAGHPIVADADGDRAAGALAQFSEFGRHPPHAGWW